jgi:hypothetical protein
LSIIHSKPDHLYANQSYFVSFPDVLDGSFDGGVEGSLVGESAIGEVPRSRVESGFISDLGLSTFGPSALHFQNLSVLVFQLLPDGVGQMLVQAEKFRKKFRSLPITHLRVPLKHADPLLSSHFGVFSEAREHPLGVAEADRAFVTICHHPRPTAFG